MRRGDVGRRLIVRKNLPQNDHPQQEPSQAQAHLPATCGLLLFHIGLHQVRQDLALPSVRSWRRRCRPASSSPTSHTWERQILSDLVQANMKEQQAARRWKMGLRLAWLLLWVVVLWQIFSHNQSTTNIATPHTALVNIKGEIADGSDASAENVVAAMRAALEDTCPRGLHALRPPHSRHWRLTHRQFHL